MKKFVAALFAMLSLTLFAGGASAGYGPGFNCKYATHAAEHAICANNQLSRLDRKLNFWFAKAMYRARHFGDVSWLKAEQHDWLGRRNACGWNDRCIANKYRQRIRALRNYSKHV